MSSQINHQTIDKKYANLYIRLLIDPKYRLVKHFLLLLFCFVISYESFYSEIKDSNLLNFILQILLIPIPLYINVYILIPRFLLKNKYISYLGYTTGVLLLTIFIVGGVEISKSDFQEEMIQHNYTYAHLFINLFSSIFTLAFTIAGTTTIVLFQHWLRHAIRIEELEKTTIQSEMEQLKNQINPHFLFNMLNNANVLVKEDPTKAVIVLSKLKDLLTYQLNETSLEKVWLKDDIQFLTDFLNLEKIRRDNFDFFISKENINDNIAIPPLLFIPFVENAVKHNNDNQNLSFVHIYFKKKDQILHFICSNSKPMEVQNEEKKGGLGLTNIKRRLELLYTNNYSLNIEENKTEYTVNLSISI